MNTLRIESKLAQVYKYKPLPADLSKKYREYFNENIPDYFKDNPARQIVTKNGSVIATLYNRIVIGDYGAFIEFNKAQANTELFVVAKGQEYRMSEKYSHVKYYWLTINDGSNIKIYYQRKGVSYADYKPDMYYVSVHEAF